MGLLSRLFGGGGDHDRRGEGMADILAALAQSDPAWSPETIRRRLRDIFFAVQRSWIERDPAIGEPYMTESLSFRQGLRIEGLLRQNRVHQLENPLIEDLDFVAYSDTSEPPRVTARLWISLVETILDAETRRLVAGSRSQRRDVQFWTLDLVDGVWLLADVEEGTEGERHMAAPLVGEGFANLSPEMILRERYAREEITIEEFETQMEQFLTEGPGY